MSNKQTAILCTMCKDILDNQDDIFGTSCGHLYHFLCIRECHGRSTNCTHCDAYKPSIFKMFLEFEKAPMSLEDQTKTLELHIQLQENMSTVKHLEEKLKNSRFAVQQLEGKLKTYNDALKCKDDTISTLEDRIVTMEELNKFLSTENSNKNDEKLKDQKKELQYVLQQLELESQNAKLPSKNLQLNSLQKLSNGGNGMKYFQNETVSLLATNYNEILASNDHIEIAQEIEGNNVFTSDGEENSNSQQRARVENSVEIRNYRLKDIKYPLEKNIIFIAKKIRMELKPDNIEKVITIKYKENSNTLIVTFKTKELKEEFLAKRHVLRNNKYLKYLNIVGHIEETSD
ncbi:uncharacterized protein ACRADG_009654 [Cochliomyia hominivorax]